MLKLYFFEVLFHFYSLFCSCSLGITDCFIYTHIKTYQITKYNILWSLLHCCCKLFEHLKMFYKSESKKDRHALIKYIYSRGFFALCVAVVGFVIFFIKLLNMCVELHFFATFVECSWPYFDLKCDESMKNSIRIVLKPGQGTGCRD